MAAAYIGITMEGIEDIAAEEVQGKKKERRRVVFEKEQEEYKTIETIYESYKEFSFITREDILEKAQKMKWIIKQPFRVT